MKSPPVTLEEPELPSSFIMDDGTDWDSHIGSIFGNHLPRKSSPIDFGVSDYAQDDFSQHAIPSSEVPGLETNTLTTSLACSPAQDEITIQDVIDADDPELILRGHDDPWSSVRPVGCLTSYPHPAVSREHFNDGRMQRDISEGFEVVESADPCYARLLWQCLREAPGYTLSLKDIYAWIRQHTQKARDPKNKGWQNSVRHNLSMNAVSRRIAERLHTDHNRHSNV